MKNNLSTLEAIIKFSRKSHLVLRNCTNRKEKKRKKHGNAGSSVKISAVLHFPTFDLGCKKVAADCWVIDTV